MYHICFSNPTAWEVSYQTGIYGNVQKTITDNSHRIIWGQIADLAAVNIGDHIFFYIKETMKLAGLFEVTSDPYYCTDDCFGDDDQLYPYRFNFKEIRHYENMVPVSDLAKLIQTGDLYSISTFERDVNATFRGIRQITFEEGDLLLSLFLKYNPKGDETNVIEYNNDDIINRIEARDLFEGIISDNDFDSPLIVDINQISTFRKTIRNNYHLAKYEYAIQGYIYFSIRRQLNNVINDLNLNNSSEWILESPIIHTQQFRSDILCQYKNGRMSKPHFYSIIEIKKDHKIVVEDLSQLIGYMKAFSEVKKVSFNSIEGVYISNKFDDRAIEYLQNRRMVEKENPIRLIEYTTTEYGNISFQNIIL